MTTETEQYRGICRDRFDRIDKKLDSIDNALRGNGSVGVMTRLDRVEQTVGSRGRFFWLLVGATLSTTAGIAAKYLGAWG